MAPIAHPPSPSTDARDDFVNADELRTRFSMAMSAMYKKEVPLYGNLVRIVKTVNDETLATSTEPHILALKNGDIASERLDIERHGAIRLGTAHELHTVRRIFQVIGMDPVGYYDLSQAGLPMHATCFRPTTIAALKKNPFRVFTTLLRPELLRNEEASRIAMDLLSQRSIFSEELMLLLDVAEKQGGRLRVEQGEAFVKEAMKTFGWKPIAAASKQTYQTLKQQHPILADIACFQSSHINHLTPRTLNIAAAQERMKAEGLAVKKRIEGPPQRSCPILLRQTSFLALEEQIQFPTTGVDLMSGSHKARFGEIEERGAAVTPAGRRLYDELLETAMQNISKNSVCKAEEQDRIIAETFARYPDTWNELRQQGLAYFTYRCSAASASSNIPDRSNREDLLALGVLEAVPITYEDFLPLSAAGIFQSNLETTKSSSAGIRTACSDQEGYEIALRRPIIDLNGWYAGVQEASLRTCAEALVVDGSRLAG
jgi:uncharacterized glyoxalase superfamily metalloenzyme YdcJ